MIEVNESLTQKVAHLARLNLSDQEVKSFTLQLKEILGYIEKLQEVNTQGVEPLIHPVAIECHLREDQPKPSPVSENGKPKILESAPDVMLDGFKVPPIL